MQQISQSFGCQFKLQAGGQETVITKWEETEQGIKMYGGNNDIYLGTVSKDTEDYEGLKSELKGQSMTMGVK